MRRTEVRNIRASTIRTVLFALLVSLFIPLTAAADDQPATPVSATEVPSSTPTATEPASTPVANEPVVTDELIAATSDPVTLTFNGVASSIFVKVGTTVTVAASPGDVWFFLYHGSGCQGDRFDFFKKSFPFTVNETYTGSVMAFDPNVDYMHPSGPCLDITWAAPKLLLKTPSQWKSPRCVSDAQFRTQGRNFTRQYEDQYLRRFRVPGPEADHRG
ncbi:MAG: SPOR domain-containing protein [Thermomicrobiales bacterium]